MAEGPRERDEAVQAGSAGILDPDERRRRALTAFAILVIVILVVLLLLLRPPGNKQALRAPESSATVGAVIPASPPASVDPTTVIVPDVVGQMEADARGDVTEVSLGVATEWVSAGEPKGTVIAQYPNAGVEVAPGTVVELTISAGLSGGASPSGPLVPDVLGLTEQQAKAKLRGRGWAYSVVSGPSTTVGPGIVFYQKPGASTRAGSGRTVTFWVSNGAPHTGTPYPRPENN